MMSFMQKIMAEENSVGVCA